MFRSCLLSRAWRRVRFTRRQVAIVLALAALGAVVVGGLAQARIETSTDSFLPEGDPVARDLREVARSFGGDPVVVVLEERSDKRLISQPQLSTVLRLEGILAELPDVASVYGPATTLNQIAGRAQDLIAELVGRRDGVRARAVSEARSRGAGGQAAERAGQEAVKEFDRRYGPLLVEAMPTGMPTLSNQRFIDSVVFGREGVPRGQWSFVVPTAETIAILVRPRADLDAASTARLIDNVRRSVHEVGLATEKTTVSGVPAVAAALNDQVLREIPLMGGIAILAVGASLLVVPWTRPRRRLLPLATTLLAVAVTVSVFGWAGQPLSIGVVAFLSVLLGVGCYYTTYFAHRVGTRTVFVVATATAASFLALALSPVPFVRDLGLTLAIGVLTSTALGWLVQRRFSENRTRWAGPDSAATHRPRTHRTRVVNGTVGAAALAVACAGWALLPGLPVQADIYRLASGLPALDDANYVSEVLRSTGELRIVVHAPDVLDPEVFAWLRESERKLILEHGDELRPTLSLTALLSFLGADPSPGQIDAGAKILPPYLLDGVVREDRRLALLNYTVDTSDIGDVERLREMVMMAFAEPPASVDVDVTGMPVVGARVNELVVAEKIWGNIAGIVAAGAVLAVGLRHRRDAVRAVGAAVLATGIGFLLLRVAGLALTPATVALGSLTSAVACEFTVLLATAGRFGSVRLRRAVALAATASAAGYAVLLASDISLVREFGLLLAVTVFLAFAASSVVVSLTVGRRVTNSVPQPPETSEREHVGASTTH